MWKSHDLSNNNIPKFKSLKITLEQIGATNIAGALALDDTATYTYTHTSGYASKRNAPKMLEFCIDPIGECENHRILATYHIIHTIYYITKHIMLPGSRDAY